MIESGDNKRILAKIEACHSLPFHAKLPRRKALTEVQLEAALEGQKFVHEMSLRFLDKDLGT